MCRIFTAVVLALLASLEGGGVMYSAKQIYLGKRGGVWRNPYITDGLVAMWDGEWNAAPRVRSSATTFTNSEGN